MKLEEGIAKLKELLFKSEAPQLEIKFETAKLNDGVTQVEWDGDLMVGVVVSVLDSTGAKLPLPMGSYILEDGTSFDVVDDMGVVDNVVMAAEEEEAVAPAEAAPTAAASENVPAAPKKVIKSQIEEHVFHLEIEGVEPISVDFSSMFVKLEAENKELKEKLNKAEEFSKEISKVVEQIADEPAKEATETLFKKQQKPTAKELSAMFRAALK